MADTVQQIKDRLSIVDVISQYVKLERSGQNFRARCPFHAERTPSFFVSPERGTYHCFGCNLGGDIFSFVEQIEGLDFKGALKVLAEKAGVPLVYERPEKKDERDRLFELLETATIFYTSRLSEPAKKYLKERGLDDEMIRLFRLGFAGEAWSDASEYFREKKFSDKEIIDAGLAKKGDRGLIDKFRNRIMFPIADSAGRVVGFSGRIFGENVSPEAPKYLNSPETPLFRKSRILYGFDKAKQAMRKHSCAVLVEGQMDLLASHQAGWANTVAVSGTAFTPEHGALIRRMTDNLVIALDPDEAGFKAAARAARAALQGGLNVKVAQLPTGLDPADLIQKEGKDAWSKTIRESKDIIVFLLDVLESKSKDKDAFRRAVETIVLPFLSDVPSPIARESYVREIAARLSVSESAVSEALAKMPTAPEGASSDAAPPEATRLSDRARQALSILLWQEAQKKPEIDVEKYKQAFAEAVGKEEFDALRALPESEQEALRFSAERIYGKSSGFKQEVETLLQVIIREKLSEKLAAATTALKEAERAGNDGEAAVHMSVVKLLTARIAQLHTSV
ncbi:DNA primase [Candidatus Parcubacteria bacterium]|nr:MAG: DNA primase [Candidatus Parcubacteria bacterium]